MRNLSPALAAHLEGDTLTLATCLLVTRTDGLRLGFTSANVPLVVDGQVYDCTGGIGSTNLKTSAGTGIDNLEALTILSADAITENDIRAGRYDNASLTMFLVNWADLSQGKLTLLRGRIGEITLTDGQCVAEVRSLTQLLAQQIGDVTGPNCRVRALGDAQCKVNTVPFEASRMVMALGVSTAFVPAAPVRQINCGGEAVSPFSADTGASGGQTGSTTFTDDVSGVTDAAPALVYKTSRYGTFSYTLAGLTAKQNYTLRLHFAEDYFGPGLTGGGGAGSRVFDVKVNGGVVLENYDIYSAAGGDHRAQVEEVPVTADASGTLLVQFLPSVDNAVCCGVEVYTLEVPAIVGGLEFGGDASPTGWYDYGIARWTSGANAGLSMEIKSHVNAGGNAVLALQLPMPFPIQAGDAATLQAGCDRRFSTCVYKFGNAANFRGEPLLPGNDKVLQVGRGQ